MSEQAGSVELIVHSIMISSTHRNAAYFHKPCQAKSSPLTPNNINHFHQEDVFLAETCAIYLLPYEPSEEGELSK